MNNSLKLLATLAVAATAAAACSSAAEGFIDDLTDAAADIGGGGDSGADVTMEDDAATDAGMCASGESCVRTRDCLTAGLGDFVCEEGCCVEGDSDTGVQPAGCGDVTYAGECDGNVVTWCQDGELGQVDCGDFFPEGITGSCEWFNDDFGYWCGAQLGDPCLYDPGDGSVTTAMCAGAGNACVFSPDSAACTSGTTECDPDAFEDPFCDGDFLAVDCNVNQIIAYDCVAYGGSCSEGACVGVAADNECDDETLVCGAGMTCEGLTDESFGTCTVTETAPTCDDGVQNGDETGVDCGGSCEECAAAPTCDDGVQNGDETGVDCGGACEECAAAPTCDDGVQNGDETGVDCGGACEECAAAPTCDDGVQNGDETGVDCGGATCSPCAST